MTKLIRHLVLAGMFLYFSAAAPGYAQSAWEYLPNAGLDTSIHSRFEDVYFTDYKTGYAVDLNVGIYKTTDGGSSWTKQLDPAKPHAQRSIEFLDDGRTGLSGGFTEEVWYTTDAGATWTDIAASIDDTTTTDIFHKSICGIAHYGDHFYAVGAYFSNTGHFYKSTDKGLTWTTSYPDTSLIHQIIDVVFLSADTGFICGSYGFGRMEGVILKTTDGGLSWHKVFGVNLGVAFLQVWKLQFIDRMHAVASLQGAHPAQLIRSDDGGQSWRLINTGLTASLVQAVGFATPLKGWLGGYHAGLLETDDGGASWHEVPFGYNFNRIFVMDSEHIYGAGGSIYRYGSGFTVGIAEQEPGKTIVPHRVSVLPNPARGHAHIRLELDVPTYTGLYILHIDSKKIWTLYRGDLGAGTHEFDWRDPTAAAGNYIVLFENNQLSRSLKFSFTP